MISYFKFVVMYVLSVVPGITIISNKNENKKSFLNLEESETSSNNSKELPSAYPESNVKPSLSSDSEDSVINSEYLVNNKNKVEN